MKKVNKNLSDYKEKLEELAFGEVNEDFITL